MRNHSIFRFLILLFLQLFVDLSCPLLLLSCVSSVLSCYWLLFLVFSRVFVVFGVFLLLLVKKKNQYELRR